MRYRKQLTDTETATEINISPLIDMVFILLLFFIVTTTFVEETGVTVDKPQAARPEQLQKNSIFLAVTVKGEVVYSGRDITVKGVRPLVERLTLKETLPVIIEVDKAARAGLVVEVIDEAKLGGATNVSLATEPPER